MPLFEDGKLTPTGAGIAGVVGGLFGLGGGSGQSEGSQGYTGGIPELVANRSLLPNAFATTKTVTGPDGQEMTVPRRPGEGGRRYFTSSAAPDLYSSTGINAAGGQRVMGQEYLDTLNAEAAAGQQFQNEANLRGIAALLGVPYDQLGSFFENRATGNTIDNGAIQNEVMGSANTPITRTQEEAPEELKGGAVGDTVYEPAYNTIKQFLGNIRNKYGNLASKEAQGEIVSFMRRYGITPKTMSLVTGYPEDKILDVIYGGFAGGGLASLSKGYYLGGSTDGMADKVPATIDGAEPARLSDGEFVVPADVVSHLGNGNSDAGAKQLYSMMDRVRKARTGTTKQGTEINPRKYLG